MLQITAVDGKGKEYGRATAFPIPGAGWVATNWHVVREAHHAVLKSPSGREYKVLGLLAIDCENDLAILAVEVQGAFPAFTMRAAPPAKLGEEIRVCGYPNPGGKPLLTQQQGKIIAAVSLTVLGQRWMTISCPGLAHGSSGSPVLAQNGEVVAVLASILRENQSKHFVIPAAALVQLSKKATTSPLVNLPPLVEGALAEPELQPLLDLIRDGKVSEAEQGITTLKRKYPTSHIPDLVEGLARDSDGQYQKAITAYEQAARKKPDSVKIWLNMGTDYCKSGNLQRGIEMLRKAAVLEPECAEIWYNLGVAYGHSDKRADSINAYERAAMLAPEEPRNWFNLCAGYINAGQNEKAKAAFANLQRLDPKGAEKLKMYMPN